MADFQAMNPDDLRHFWSKLKTVFNTKQNTIADLSNIRHGAELGESAVQPASIVDMATKTWVGDQDYANKTYVQGWHDSTKQDLLNDLQAIREGASAGATAVQPSALNAYRTSSAQDVIDATKVDKVTGKGLSTNDYDNTEKGLVASAEQTSNKVTSFQSTPDDTHYPSEKLVSDTIEGEHNEMLVKVDGRIKKFFTSNLLNTSVSDADDGTIRSLKIWGRGSQGANPSPSSPQAIHSVVNPKLTVYGRNVLIYPYYTKNSSPTAKSESQTFNGVTFYVDSDGYINLNGTASGQFDLKIFGVLGNTAFNLLPNYAGSFYMNIEGDVTNISGVFIAKNGSTVITASQASNTFALSSGDYINCIMVRIPNGAVYSNAKIRLWLTTGNTATSWEQYKSQTATLSKTLNAIPVSSGGNVTIDGQMYIADYVDIEAKKLVRNIATVDMGTLDWTRYATQTSGKYRFVSTGIVSLVKKPTSLSAIAHVLSPNYSVVVGEAPNQNIEGVAIHTNGNILIYDVSKDTVDAATFKTAMSGVYLYYELATPTEEPLTDAEVADFLTMRSYYGTTNATVTSDDLTGASEFLYPCSIENFVEYVKEQEGDTRTFIYNLEDRTDSATIQAELALAILDLS